MKSGTTSLHRYLSAHPQVFMSEPKEPNFFVEELNWQRGLDWYLGLFASAGNATVIGESSTEYTKLPTYTGVARRIHAFNPEARLIYLMRDPVDRIRSHYWHNVADLTNEAERRNMRSAVREDPRYVAYSNYAMQLEPYLELFGRERIALLTAEQLAADPTAVVTMLCRWLGLTGVPPAETFTERWNVRPAEGRSVRGRGLLNRLRHTAFWRALRPWWPRPLRDIGLRLAERRAPLRDKSELEAIDYLRPILRVRVEALAQLVERDFPEWKTLHGLTGESGSGEGIGTPADPPSHNRSGK
jgi:hypothetical protein